ncbi:hypothetical protein U9M48_007504 [Paspalum notatum var. saurae]|uniref:Uncharacterized protein n=1 Tax=Paspalum notatum var. saurae TaxID=547442 RepID=A0AAQ3SH37_PASNO
MKIYAPFPLLALIKESLFNQARTSNCHKFRLQVHYKSGNRAKIKQCLQLLPVHAVRTMH